MSGFYQFRKCHGLMEPGLVRVLWIKEIISFILFNKSQIFGFRICHGFMDSDYIIVLWIQEASG